MDKGTKNKSRKLLELLGEKYPSRAAVYGRLIRLQASLSLPKGIEHFMSDLHGEYGSFYHILNNCSGVIKEKVDYVFGERLSPAEKAEFCTLIYYPREKIAQVTADKKYTPAWQRKNLTQLLEVTKLMSYKYPAAKVAEMIPAGYQEVIRELITTHPEDDKAQSLYLNRLVATIVQIDSAADFILAFAELIKKLAVDHLHIVGDFFDRGNRPDAILNKLMEHSGVDIEWGNHDVLWMGAAMGSEVCIAAVIRNSLRYQNTEVLERGYGINLRPLTTFASRIYPDEAPIKAAEKAAAIMMFKLEGQMIARNPDFKMEGRRLLHQIDYRASYAMLNGERYELKSAYFPTIEDSSAAYELTAAEQKIMAELKSYFVESAALQRHLDYLYEKGSLYLRFNGNLLFHGCVPLEEDGSFRKIIFEGKELSGKKYFDYAEKRARSAWLFRRQADLDFMYFLWCGRLSPLSGREMKTFERTLIADESTWKEPADPYFHLIGRGDIAEKVLAEFGLSPEKGHIINGHVPVKVKKGETPIKAGGKAIVIDGGFCKAYHNKTGIAGYTLISNSRGLRLLEHAKIADVKAALKENGDIESVAETVEIKSSRTTLADTDEGALIQEEITDLYNLLLAYQNGILREKNH